MDTDRRKIINIINFTIKELGLFTNSKTHKKVLQRFENSKDESIYYIVTNGVSKIKPECRSCHTKYHSSYFGFYQTRVDGEGYLMRSNALCKGCEERNAKMRKVVFENNKDRIPKKPEPGSMCPKCERHWDGEWHRHHKGK